MMDFVMPAVFVAGCIVGFVFRRLVKAIVVGAIGGLGLAIAYHLWLVACPARGNALEDVGYLMAFAYPLSGCALGWFAARVRRKRR